MQGFAVYPGWKSFGTIYTFQCYRFRLRSTIPTTMNTHPYTQARAPHTISPTIKVYPSLTQGHGHEAAKNLVPMTLSLPFVGALQLA